MRQPHNRDAKPQDEHGLIPVFNRKKRMNTRNVENLQKDCENPLKTEETTAFVRKFAAEAEKLLKIENKPIENAPSAIAKGCKIW